VGGKPEFIVSLLLLIVIRIVMLCGHQLSIAWYPALLDAVKITITIMADSCINWSACRQLHFIAVPANVLKSWNHLSTYQLCVTARLTHWV